MDMKKETDKSIEHRVTRRPSFKQADSPFPLFSALQSIKSSLKEAALRGADVAPTSSIPRIVDSIDIP
ncbi:hypothetical protein PCK1_003066 [Pneumocystis canis]|nr:hypothetical protein PCK1_003066 [Pneumocystis canis]